MRLYAKRFFLFIVAFAMVFNSQFYTANAAIEADASIEANAALTSGGETKQVIVYQNNSTELSDLLGKLMADTVEVKKVGDRYEVEVSFPQGQDVQEFALSGAKVEQKITDAESATKVYTVTVDDLTEIQDATITMTDGSTQTVQMQFEGEQNPFGDIQGLANYSKIVSLFSRGVFKESDQFHPNSPTTRYQFALMLYRALDIEVDLSQAKDFKDLNNLDAETVDAIKALNAFGVINGVSADRFSPHATITRSQAARMIYRVLEKLGYTADDEAEMAFSDIPNADEELLKATAALNKLGIMTGYQGEFSPDAPLTRDQMSKVLYTSLEVEEVAAVAVTGKSTSSTSNQDAEPPSKETESTEEPSKESTSTGTSSVVTPSIVIPSTPSVVTPSTPSVVTPTTDTYGTSTPTTDTYGNVSANTVKVKSFAPENVVGYSDNTGLTIPLKVEFENGANGDLSKVPLTIKLVSNDNYVMNRSENGKSYTLQVDGDAIEITVGTDNTLLFQVNKGTVPVGYKFSEIRIGISKENMVSNAYTEKKIWVKVLDKDTLTNPDSATNDEEGKDPVAEVNKDALIKSFDVKDVTATKDNRGVTIPLNVVFKEGVKADLSQVEMTIKFSPNNVTAMTRSEDGKSYSFPFESIKWVMTVTENNDLLFTVNGGTVPVGYKFSEVHIGIPGKYMENNAYTEQVISFEVVDPNGNGTSTGVNGNVLVQSFKAENVTGYKDNDGVIIPLNVLFEATSEQDLSKVPLTIKFSGNNQMIRSNDGKTYTLKHNQNTLKMTVTEENNLLFTVNDGPVPAGYAYASIAFGISKEYMVNQQAETQTISFKVLNEVTPAKDTEVKDTVITDPEASKKKYAILVVAGQSNAVGYDESAVDPNDPLYQVHDRINQLGLRGDNNLDIIPLTYSAENFQNMTNSSNPNSAGKLGTKGIHLPLGHLLLDYIPEDYELIIIPAAFGGTGFTTSSPYGEYDAANKKPVNLSSTLRWGVQSAYYQTIKDRISYLLDLNKDNYYIGTVWCQGEHDSSNPIGHWAGFEAMTQDFFDYFNEKYPNRVAGGKSWSKDQWFTYFTVPYWYSATSNASGAVLIWMNYAYWSPSTIVPIFFTDGSENYTNQTNGTGKTSRIRASHYGNNAFAKYVAPAVIQAMESSGLITKNK